MEEPKVRAVREYLLHEFPGHNLYDFFDPGRGGHVFQVQDNLGAIVHLVVVRLDFLLARSEAEIAGFLHAQRLARALGDAGRLPVVVTSTGLVRDAA